MIGTFNVRMRDELLLKRIKIDSIEQGVSLQDYAQVCFSEFLSLPISMRRCKFAHRVKRKTVGAKPHPEGIFAAVCVDVLDLGMVENVYQGEVRIVPMVRLIWETDAPPQEGGRVATIGKKFRASLHSKAKLTDFLGKWRGRAVAEGERLDLGRLIGECCTLVVSHQKNQVGRTYASIDAVAKPTRKLAASGTYDPAEARRRVAWRWSWGWRGPGRRGLRVAPSAAPRRPGAEANIGGGMSGIGYLRSARVRLAMCFSGRLPFLETLESVYGVGFSCRTQLGGAAVAPTCGCNSV